MISKTPIKCHHCNKEIIWDKKHGCFEHKKTEWCSCKAKDYPEDFSLKDNLLYATPKRVRSFKGKKSVVAHTAAAKRVRLKSSKGRSHKVIRKVVVRKVDWVWRIQEFIKIFIVAGIIMLGLWLHEGVVTYFSFCILVSLLFATFAWSVFYQMRMEAKL